MRHHYELLIIMKWFFVYLVIKMFCETVEKELQLLTDP